MPAARASGAMVAKCWRARISVGAMNAACRPASITVGGGEQRDHGLARADIALQQPQHALRLRQVGDDVVDRALLRRRERIGQGGDDAPAQPPSPALPRPPRLRIWARSKRQRELAGEKFVIGKPRPGRGFGPQIVGGSAGRCTARSASAKPGEPCATARSRSCHSVSAGSRSSASSIALRT